MDIGIITYHFAENYGSALQTYGLFRYLQQHNNGNVEVLNFVSPSQESNNSLYGHRSGLQNILLTCAYLPFHPWRKRKRDRFRSFISDNINLSTRVADVSKLREYINKRHFDVIVSGSDQVWNPKIEDFNEAFFFPFDTNARKVGYAISLGSATSKEIEKYNDYIDDFSIISCREQGAAEQLDSIGYRLCPVVCDPVFLLPKSDWENVSNASAVDYSKDDPYIVCYFINKTYMNQYFSWTKNIADEYGYKVKIINAAYSRNIFRRGILLDVGPKEFVNLIRNSAFVCTDSFHGTAFSVIFGKQFLSFDTPLGSTDTRKSDLLNIVGLEDRIQRVGHELDTTNLEISSYRFSESKARAADYIRQSVRFIDDNILCI